MANNKKGVILIRFPEKLANDLRIASVESGIAIKDIVSEIVDKNLVEWRREHAVESLKKTSAELFALQDNIEDYAAKKKISIKQACDELGLTPIFEKALADIDALSDHKKPVKKAAGQ